MKVLDLCCEVFPHAQYLPGLTPSDFFLIPILKKGLGGRSLTSNAEAKAGTTTYFAELGKAYGIKKLKIRWSNFFFQGDYVEK